MKMFRLLRLAAVMLLLAVATTEEAHGDNAPRAVAFGRRQDWQQQWFPALMALMGLVNTHSLCPLLRMLMRLEAAPPDPPDYFHVKMKRAEVRGRRPLGIERGADGRLYIRMINDEQGAEYE